MTTWNPTYCDEEGWTTHVYHLPSGNKLRVAAKDVRRERTGVHAVVDISVNWKSLARSNFNIERDEERLRLANSAHKHIDESHELDRVAFPQNTLKHATDLFCNDLWEHHVGAQVGGMLQGDPEIQAGRSLLSSFILQEAGTLLFGQPGTGKSYTALAAAGSIMHGVEKIWPVHAMWRPLYINVERSAASMASRLARVNRALGLDPRTPLPFLNARGKSLADLYEAAQKTIAQEECQLVFYDSISRAGFGSLTGDDVANKIMDMLNSLSPTWVALAHSPRADDSHAFGSQMFDAAADLTVQLRSQTSHDGLSTGVGIQVIKANDIRKPPMSVHALEWDADGLCGIRSGQNGEFAELIAGERRSKEDQVRDYLLEIGGATAGQVAEHFGWARNHTSTMLNASGWAQKERRGRETVFRVKSEGVPS